MTRSKWLAALESNHLAVELAHMLCLPEGELKEKMRAYIEDSFAEDSDRERNARQDLYPYLAASKLYGEWDWHTQDGLYRRRGRPVEPKLRSLPKMISQNPQHDRDP